MVMRIDVSIEELGSRSFTGDDVHMSTLTARTGTCLIHQLRFLHTKHSIQALFLRLSPIVIHSLYEVKISRAPMTASSTLRKFSAHSAMNAPPPLLPGSPA